MADVIERLRVAHRDATLQPIMMGTDEAIRLLTFDGARSYFTQYTDPGEPDLEADNAPAPLVLSRRYGYMDIGRDFWRRALMEGLHSHECILLLTMAGTCNIHSACYVDCCHGVLTFFEILADDYDEESPFHANALHTAIILFQDLASRLDSMAPAAVRRLCRTGWGESIVPFGGLSENTLATFPTLLNAICASSNRAHVFLFEVENDITDALHEAGAEDDYTYGWAPATKAYFGV